MKAYFAKRVLDLEAGLIEKCPLVEAFPAIREVNGQDIPIWLLDGESLKRLPSFLAEEPGFSADEEIVGNTKVFRHLDDPDILLVKAKFH